MTGLIDTVAPPRLGVGYRWLLGSSWTANLGDGFGLAAGPLLRRLADNNAFVVSLAALVQWLPPLLFGLSPGPSRIASTDD